MEWRAGILKDDGTRDSENFDTKEEAELWVLEQALFGIKKSIIFNKKNIRERFVTNWKEKING